MPLGSSRHRRGSSVLLRWMTLTATAWLACSAPDGSDLYRPMGAAGSVAGAGGSAAGGSAASGSGGSGGSSAAGLGGAAAGSSGAGGNLPAAGAAAGGGSGAAGDSGAAPSDAGTPDAGGESDAGPSGPPPPGCEPRPELCDGVDDDCDGEIDSSADDSSAVCPDGCTGLTLGGRAYMVCVEPVARSVALARCGGEGMRLAWIESSEENAAVLAALGDVEFASAGEALVQIGASDQDDEDEWFWVGDAAASGGFQFWSGNAAEDGGDPVAGAYANWAAGEPNNSDNEDCGALSVSGSSARAPGEWDDRACLDELPFLCEEP